MKFSQLTQKMNQSVEFKPSILDENDEIMEHDFSLLVNHVSCPEFKKALSENHIRSLKLKKPKKAAGDEAWAEYNKELVKLAEKNDVNMFSSVIVGWKGATDENDQSMPFSKDAINKLLESDFGKTLIGGVTYFDKDEEKQVRIDGLVGFISKDSNFFS